MNALFKTIQKDKILFWSFSLSIFFIVVNCIIIALAYIHLPPFLPLYNKLPWGYSRLGTRIELFLPSIIALIFIISNVIITHVIHHKVALLARLLAAITVALSFFTTIYTIQTIRLIL